MDVLWIELFVCLVKTVGGAGFLEQQFGILDFLLIKPNILV